MSKILIIDDDVDVLSAAKLFLKRHFSQVDIEKNPERIPFLVGNGNYDVILLDMNFTRDVNTGKEGFEWLDKILDIDPNASVVLFTAYGDVEMAVRAIKVGASDFVLKPWENDKLLATMQSAYEIRLQKTGKNKPQGSTAQKPQDTNIIGSSPAMSRVFETIDRVANTDANVLILGENGTGKDLIARALHNKSNRADKPFVAVDLGAIAETLFESELFGHTKGSFTDAKEDRLGRFEEANGGTIFLDEIGNIPLHIQAKLLTVLQNRVVTKVGSNKPKTIDVRLICATNMPVYQMVTNKEFRQDLLYRINTIEIKLPPLRERPEDILPLAEHYLKVYRKKYNRPVNSVSATLAKQLQRYHWPGNVRELQHAIERAVILAQGNTLQPEDFFFETQQSQAPSFDQTFQLDEMEKAMIVKTLKKFNGNITEAAKELGLTRASLYRRIEKYGI
ncbi:MAG: sigma-54-dependent transcriptional regulator [Spirosomataceae bacterium]